VPTIDVFVNNVRKVRVAANESIAAVLHAAQLERLLRAERLLVVRRRSKQAFKVRQ